ncbi:hypothetical protein BJY01DRAFT_233907 [Aspergillus pseudoustus]|uniref:Derlin n=1 Tax=Aspergillus pseudoustus TaxID=1810923 RepID=A0ABR4K844_9EURO
MSRATLRFLLSNRRLGTVDSIRNHSSFSKLLHDELTSRQLPLFFDYLHPQPSHLLDLTLTDLFPLAGSFAERRRTLHASTRPSHLPAGHHLVYFPPQVTLSELLPDGTDTLHTPGSPFNRRLWAGGSVRLSAVNPLLLDGNRAVCIEIIRDVVVKGRPGEENIVVKIERRIGAVQEGEEERDVRRRISGTDEGMGAYTSILETRDLVFMRDKSPEQLKQDKAGFSQVSRTIKCYRNLLVHGPLTLTLLLTALRLHLDGKGVTFSGIDYKNLAPVYVDEQLTICGKPKSTEIDDVWDVWIEGRDGAMDDFKSLPPVARTLTALTFIQSALVLSGSVNYFWVPFFPQLIFTWKIWPQIWRFVTPFLMTDPKLNFVFDLYFMYTYSSRLEFGSPRFSTPGSFFVYVLFIGSVIMDNKGTKTMFFVVEIPTPMLPWARLALTFVMKGYHSAAVEFTGIVAAHLYDFLTRIYPAFGGGKNYIITPAFVRRLFTRSLRGGQERVYGQAFRPPNEQEESSGWASSVRDTWGSRGSGQRLGGN